MIYGEAGDATLLGALTLEALGLALDPLKRSLKPQPMILARTDQVQFPPGNGVTFDSTVNFL